MPTIHGQLTGTTDTVIYAPPLHRKMVPTVVRIVNSGSNTITVTLKQVAPDSTAQVIDEITLPAGQEFGMTLDSGVYDLDRGSRLAGVLSDTGTVSYTITYRLE